MNTLDRVVGLDLRSGPSVAQGGSKWYPATVRYVHASKRAQPPLSLDLTAGNCCRTLKELE
jgi:hypothetical protein